ncbi:TPA: Arc family DNA-binding protein [Yersinia enterocolitica]|uniref:Arc family DNA-binding protein n=1 Tax=Yersinia TaxID=629 RepID=UPI0005E481B3|nr:MULTISPECIES: Arc family DNA-binding protein [Yersinia]AOF18425.1 hypothetical protein BED34_07160 [Yersinia enterocolitica]AOF22956.1 hypothetical protein BED33_09820 [Yersinia enterocolitica]AOF26666.1 hypothetical protein BED32_07135 [Yersinia enterocolitica]AOF30779.1 hypothetical protein BED35_07610 [Yersinia enterocolitica]AOF34699.1 hypothetical protein BFS78_06680 [Yersinia enterocolitica]
MKGASQIAPLGVRLPEDLKAKIQEKAKENGRSMNAEIVSTIESSFSQVPDQEIANFQELLSHYQTMLELKEQIITSLRDTISYMESTISSLRRHIEILEEHVALLKKQNGE